MSSSNIASDNGIKRDAVELGSRDGVSIVKGVIRLGLGFKDSMPQVFECQSYMNLTSQ